MEKIITEEPRANNIEKILEQLAINKNSAKLVLADYKNERKLLESSIITEQQFKVYEQMISERMYQLPPDEPNDLIEEKLKEKATVFLSYNNQDRQTATQIRDELKQYHIGVKLDLYNVGPGQDIKEFIRRQTKENNAVMMLVSRNSLVSSWVSYEVTLAMYDQILNNQKIYYLILDNSCLDNNFSGVAFKEFDKKISSLRDEIKIHEANDWDPRHLHTELQNFIDGRHQLAPILQKLKTRAVNSIMGEDFRPTLRRIAEQLTRNSL